MDRELLTLIVVVAVPAVLLATVSALVLVGVVVVLMRRRSAGDADAVELWARGAYGLWTGGEDSAGWDEHEAREALSAWHGATDRDSLLAAIDRLCAGNDANPAWDGVRAVDALRLGVAGGYLSDDQCWDEVRRVAPWLRRAYGSWDALAAAFEVGMHAWQEEHGVIDDTQRSRVRRHLPILRREVWSRIGYGAPL
jgi:hypothetical protein